MNCDDYLSMLATVPVEEMSYGRAREHSAGCRECDRVTRVVAERERNMRLAYGDLYSSVPAVQTASSALVSARRRKVSLFYRTGVGLVTAAMLVFLVSTRLVPRSKQPGLRVSETFRLQCLSPEQAAEILRPSLEHNTMMSFNPTSPLGIIKVETSPGEMAKAKALMDRYDNSAQSQCAVQVTVPKTTSPE